MANGMFLVTPPHVPLDIQGPGRCEVLMVAIPWRALCPVLEHAAARPVPDLGRLHAGLNRDAAVERLVRLLWQETAGGTPYDGLFADGLLLSLSARLLALAEHPVVPAPPDGLSPADLRRVLSFIHDQLADDLSLDALASVVHLSPYHFCRLFKQSTSQSPHRFVIQERVERAKSLLLSGRLTVGEIALVVGFGNQAHLSLHFKRLTGVTPKQFSKHSKNP